MNVAKIQFTWLILIGINFVPWPGSIDFYQANLTPSSNFDFCDNSAFDTIPSAMTLGNNSLT